MATTEILDLEDKARLNLTLTTRENIIHAMVKNGTIPSDQEDRDFLIKALDGMDRTVLSKTKIKIEDRALKGQQENARMIADILSKVPVKNTQGRGTDIPSLPEEITVTNPVPGEKDIGVSTSNYKEFMERNS